MTKSIPSATDPASDRIRVGCDVFGKCDSQDFTGLGGVGRGSVGRSRDGIRSWRFSRRGFHGGGFHGGGFRGYRGGFEGYRRGLGYGALGLDAGLGLGSYYGGYYGSPNYAAGYNGGDCCVVRRQVWTPYGWRLRPARVCG